MSQKNEEVVQKKVSLRIPLVFGMGIGAVLGLLTYIKDWI